MNIEFVEIPPGGRCGNFRDPQIAAFGQALRDNPGRWAIYPIEYRTPHDRASAARYIRTGRNKSLGGNGFEAVARRGAIYVRYVGGDA